MMGWVLKGARFTFEVLVTAVEGVLWIGHGLRQLVLIGWDATRGLWGFRGSMLRCPDGHAFPISGHDLAYDFECSACGWRWSAKFGTELRCTNVECAAPNAPFVACPTCGLSVRNPFRWGRP